MNIFKFKRIKEKKKQMSRKLNLIRKNTKKIILLFNINVFKTSFFASWLEILSK